MDPQQRRAFAIALFVLDVDVLISAGFRSSMNTVILPFRPTSTPNANRAFAIRPLVLPGRWPTRTLEGHGRPPPRKNQKGWVPRARPWRGSRRQSLLVGARGSEE